MAISMEKVWTVAREKDDTPVFREWFGVKVQAPRCIPNERWILCKDPGRAAAFTVDPDKVFATQAKALASTKPVTCFFVEGFDVRKTKGFYNGAGILRGFNDRGNVMQHTKVFVHESAANTELRKRLIKSKKELVRGVKSADRILRKLRARKPRKPRKPKR
jgi:hypothetical protein